MKKIIFILFIGLSAWQVQAQKTDVAPIYATKAGAIKGYDPVAYFTESQAIKGLDSITYTWQGTSWHFVSTANRDLFKQSPEKYAPQFGGYCAYGWAQGYAVKIEPESWSIVDDKLYLNYDLSIKRKWDKKQQAYIQQAIKNWQNTMRQ
jgi:hypothetical protein